MTLVRLCDICQSDQSVKYHVVATGPDKQPLGVQVVSDQTQIDLCGECAHFALSVVLPWVGADRGRTLVQALLHRKKHKEVQA